ncbi:MAG: hypothetical protein QXI10_01220 [Candidatus Diapherotrites archaeon]
MELFKLISGPWEKIFSGNFQGHDIEIYSNPEKILLVLIFEKKLDVVQGAIVEMYKVFYAEGDVTVFTETLPREVIGLTKHDENLTLKFFLLGSKPSYVQWSEDTFLAQTDSMIKRLEASSSMVKDISKAYGLTLKEIHECSEEVRSAFFTQPLVPLLLSTSSHKISAQYESQVISLKSDVMLGLTKDKKKVFEPLLAFFSTIISEGNEVDRAKVMQVIAESALLVNVPVIFFDFNKHFVGLGEASKNIVDIEKYSVGIDPIGFPLKIINGGTELKVDINVLSYEAVADLFRIGDKDFARVMNKVVANKRFATLKDLFDGLLELRNDPDFTEFEIFKAIRIMRLLDLMNPNIFGGYIDVEDLVKQGNAGIARASVIKLENLNDKASLLLIYSVVKNVRNYFAAKGLSQAIRLIINVPKGSLLKEVDGSTMLSREVSSLLIDAQENGVAYIVGAQHSIDINQEIRSDAKAKIDIVLGNDVGVQLKNSRSYRVLVRPTLSKSPS